MKFYVSKDQKNKLYYISEKFEFPGGEQGETKRGFKTRVIWRVKYHNRHKDIILTVIHQFDFELTHAQLYL
jgi:hypothetical protein